MIRYAIRSLAAALHARRERQIAELERDDPRAARMAREEHQKKLERQAAAGFGFWRRR